MIKYYGLNVSKLNIAQVNRKCVITKWENYNGKIIINQNQKMQNSRMYS